jgi:DNA-binding transcriptional MerR regulator
VPDGRTPSRPTLTRMPPDPLPPDIPPDVPPVELDPADAALATAVRRPVDDTEAPYDLAALAREVGASETLLTSVARAGLLLPHHVTDDGTARYSAADVEAVRAGLTLLDAGLPLSELLALAGPTDAAVRDIAERAVEAFLRFVRDPVIGSVLGAGEDDEVAGARLVTAYERMLPATERLVAHHLRRRLILAALERLAASGPADGDG